MTVISSMELSTLLNKSKACLHNLTLAEFRIVTYLLSCANTKDGHGYKCYPSTETIAECCGIHSSTVEKLRPKLVKAGWFQYVQGRGAKNCNTYFVNGFKIVEIYMLSGHKRPAGIIAPTVLSEEATKKKPKKNKENLSQNQQKETPVQTPQAVPELDYDDPDLPEWAR